MQRLFHSQDTKIFGFLSVKRHVVTVLVVLITTVNFLLVNEFCEICGS